jgi:hypothetical protein
MYGFLDAFEFMESSTRELVLLARDQVPYDVRDEYRYPGLMSLSHDLSGTGMSNITAAKNAKLNRYPATTSAGQCSS